MRVSRKPLVVSIPSDCLISVNALAEILGVSEDGIKAWVVGKDIRRMLIARKWVISTADLLRELEKHGGSREEGL